MKEDPEPRPSDDERADEVDPPMTVREALLADGRYVIFFSFDDDV